MAALKGPLSPTALNARKSRPLGNKDATEKDEYHPL